MMKRYRPRLDIPRTSLDTMLEIAALLFLLANIVLTIWNYLALPNTVPTHFGITGQPDSYGSKNSIFFLPVISIIIYPLFVFLTRRPHIYNYPVTITEENAPRQYYLARLLLKWVLVEMNCMWLILQWLTIQAAYNSRAGSILLAVPLICILLLVTIGIYIRKALQAR